jgi:hypothetical protein
MGGAPVLVTVYRNGIHMRNTCRSWIDDAEVLAKCHEILRSGGVDALANKLWAYDAEFSEICKAFPAVDTLDVDDKSGEDYTP